MKPYFYIMNADQNIICKRDNLESAKVAAESCALNWPGAVYEILKCVGISTKGKADTVWLEDEPKTGEVRYRYLELGEIVQEGDEFRSMFNGWTKARILGGKVVTAWPYRRQI